MSESFPVWCSDHYGTFLPSILQLRTPMAGARFHTPQSFRKQVTIPSHGVVRCSAQHTSDLIITLLQHELIWKRLAVEKDHPLLPNLGTIFAHYSEGS